MAIASRAKPPLKFGEDIVSRIDVPGFRIRERALQAGLQYVKVLFLIFHQPVPSLITARIEV